MPDLASVLNKLVQLDDDFGPSPDGYWRFMKILQSIKTRDQWNNFLTDGTVNGHGTNSSVRAGDKKKTGSGQKTLTSSSSSSARSRMKKLQQKPKKKIHRPAP